MDRRPVLVAGGGIGGLCVALTLHQIDVPCLVLESVRHLQPLGVGINMQPNAVRELYELGIGPDRLDAIGLQTREFVLVGLNGKEAMIQTVAQALYAKAALVDYERLAAAQRAADLVRAESCLQDAFATDVRPAIAEWRRERGLPDDPLDAFRQSGYLERVTAARARPAIPPSSSYA